MKRTIGIMLILALVFCLGACTEEKPEQKEDAFILEVINECDDEVYGFHIEYSLDGQNVSGGGGVNADGSAVSKSDSFYFEFNKKDKADSDDISALTAQINVITDENGAEIPIDEKVSLNAKFGEAKSVVVRGNAESGYTVETKEN